MPENTFNTIVQSLCQSNDLVDEGPMMSAPGLRYKQKVFAFYHNNEMVFKLGKGFDLTPYGIEQFTHLSPFKKKPPMAAWFCIGTNYKDQWPLLAEEALLQMEKKMG